MYLPTALITVATLSYLLGSIPFGYILVRLFLKQDIRSTGSGNIGATNVARSGKTGLAIATLVLDAAKGAIAVLVAEWIFAAFVMPLPAGAQSFSLHRPMLPMALAALFTIIGHMFPVWLKFRGGKGVATGAGAFIALAPLELTATIALFALIVAVTRYVSLGSIAATVTFPFLLWAARADWRTSPLAIILVFLSAALILFRHRDNIRRLINGTENKFGKSKFRSSPTQVEKQA
jgi:glycerol-3-phosphate acyltransferase PlsY